MADYDSDFIYMIPLPYKNREDFFEDIHSVPARIRGAFIIDDNSKETIDFMVVTPSNQILYSNSTSQCIFEFTANEVGKYTISFANHRSNSEVRVTFTMNTGQNKILTKTDLTPTEKKLGSVLDFIKKFNLEFKMNRNVHVERYKSKF